MGLGGVTKIMQLLSNYLAPDAADSAYPEVARFLQFKCTTQMTDEYLVRFDQSRSRAEPKPQMGGAFPGKVASVLCMRNAYIPQTGKPLMPDGA